MRAMIQPEDPQGKKLTDMAGLDVVEADLGDQSALDSACRGVTHIVHLGAQLVRRDTPVDRFYDVNAFGTLRLLEAAVRNGGVERFVLASTDGTYRPGNPPEVPLTERSPQEPADYYGTSKLLGEIILRNHSAQYGIPFSIVRFATVVSPEEALSRFRLYSMRALLSRAKLEKDSNIWQLFDGRPGLSRILDESVGDAGPDTAVGFTGPDGEPWSLHMVDVRDAVDGVYRALVDPAALGGVFNIAGESPTSHEEGASALSEVFAVPKIMVGMPMTWRLEVSIESARKKIGYQPKYGFREMVEVARAAALDTSVDVDFIPARL